ncbi:MAG TPA: glycosyltransferase [Cyclobacteriaceae bacterium]
MVKDQALVSVVCLCYNQHRWVEEAVESVLGQTYPNIEIVLADDASTDGSQAVIARIKQKNPRIRVLLSDRNRGNCKSFNSAFRETQGEFIVDFAADDIMKPDRIEKQLRRFGALDDSYGVVFTDADYMDADGKFIRRHYTHLRSKGLLKKVPEGFVYRDVLSRYFIAAPTMLVRRSVLDQLGGYDESLSYEDFDFWVRSSRDFKYAFVNEPLTLIRRAGQSMSARWYKPGDKQLYSTYLVCRKAMELNRDDDDRSALILRVRYELRQSVLSDNHNEARLFYQVLEELGATLVSDRLFMTMSAMRLPMSAVRDFYHSIRYR